MIGSSKNTGEIIGEHAFEHKKKKPGINANRPSNNRAKMFRYALSIVSEIIMEAVVYGKVLAFTISVVIVAYKLSDHCGCMNVESECGMSATTH